MTVKELDELIQKLYEQDKKIDDKKAELTELNKEYTRLEFRAAAHLKELGRDNYASEFGKVEFKEEWRVKMPTEDIKTKEFLSYLKSNDLFDQMVTVHAQKLKAWYNREWEAAKERGEGMEFSVPGIDAPVVDTIPNFKPAKRKEAKSE